MTPQFAFRNHRVRRRAALFAFAVLLYNANVAAAETDALRISIDVPSMLNAGSDEDAVQDKPKKSAAPERRRMRVNEAVMVTVELPYGKTVPTIAEALKDVERRYKPSDGKGRTFAILDAYGSTTPEGKLHMSMHVSAEKAGTGMLVFTPTGEVLWKGDILPLKKSKNTKVFTGKELIVLLGVEGDRTYTVDGSMNPATIIGAHLKEPGIPVRDFWKEGEERDVVFIYSACGCPVKVKVRREGEKTVRTSELPVIFPDDPAVVLVIKRLMGW